MKREEFAKKIRWPAVISVVGIANPCFMIPQLVVILLSGQTEGLSLLTLIILFLVQMGFAAHGFFLRDPTLMLSNSAASLVTLSTTVSTVIYRFFL